MNERPVYVVHLQAGPNTDGVYALRRGLKTLLRRYRLRCVALATVKDGPKKTAQRRA